MKELFPLSTFLTEYIEKNSDNKYKPVAVGRYGIRTRESIYTKELAKDYSKNKLIYKNTLTVGMGSVQIDIGILTDNITYSVSPAYHTYRISGINTCYLNYCLEYYNRDMFERFAKRGSRQGKSINLKQWIAYKIPVPDEKTQVEIVRNLDGITTLIKNRQGQLELLNKLVKSRFIEMFGEPVINPFSWNTKKLLDMGYCKNGMNYHTGDYGVKINCLGVGDFKDLFIIDNTEQLPYISLNEIPADECMLKDEDIVFVRSNGNKELVGRCLVVYPKNTPTTYSGFCIRYRKTSDDVNTIYLLYVLKCESIRKQMLGRGANIQNLNQQILSNLIVPIPPIELQEQFSNFAKQVDKSKFECSISLNLLKLFNFYNHFQS